MAAIPDDGHALPRAVLHLGQRRRDGDHLPRRVERRHPDLYEAAAVDGAGLWRKIWHVTLPQLRGVLLVTLILQIIGTAQVFLEPYLFTSGGPNNATITILLLIYNYAFGNSLGGDYGQATALSLMLAAFLAVLSLVYLRVTRSWSQRAMTHQPGRDRHAASIPAASSWEQPRITLGTSDGRCTIAPRSWALRSS